jgi:hypothetical protein
MLKEMAESGERDTGQGGNRKSSRFSERTVKPKLADLGVTKKQSLRQAGQGSRTDDRATEIRLRAERGAGEMLKEMADIGERARGGEKGRREFQPRTPR